MSPWNTTPQRQNAKIWNKYSQKRNIGASVPISTFICLWANYIFPRWFCLFCWRNYVNRSWEYINRSQTHECRNWGWGRAIPRKGIYKRNCRCSVEYSYRNYPIVLESLVCVGWVAVILARILGFSSSSLCRCRSQKHPGSGPLVEGGGGGERPVPETGEYM